MNNRETIVILKQYIITNILSLTSRTLTLKFAVCIQTFLQRFLITKLLNQGF
jgi:hypothetical protein